MFFENGFSGLALRFFIDKFIKLSPIPKKPFQFRGNCPFTEHLDNVVVNEFRETIKFGQLGLEISGGQLVKKLYQLYRDHGKEADWRPNITRTALGNQNSLCLVNQQLKRLEKDIREILERIEAHRYENTKYWFDFDACLQVDYYICPTHRLFHDESENILCRQDFLIFRNEDDKYQIPELAEKSGILQCPLKFDFEECYLFHNLHGQRNCEFEDILQISDIHYSLILKYDFHRKLISLPVL